MLVLSSDHVIGDEQLFADTVKQWSKEASKTIITFGVQPSSPHTGYGYILAQNPTTCSRVIEFKEKPDAVTAKEYLAKGYLWNSGIFLFNVELFIKELRAINPAYLNIFETESSIVERFQKLPDISVDYGILEKSTKVSTIPFP